MSETRFGNPVAKPHLACSSSRSRKGMIAFAIISIVLAIGAFVPFLVNVLQGRIDWSLYPLGAIAMTWLILAPWFVVRRHRAALSWAMAAITVPPYLFLVESLSSARGWFVHLGLPAAVLGLAAAGGIIWLWCYSRISPWYALASTFLVLGLLSWAENLVARPFLVPDPIESTRNFVTLAIVGVSILFGLVASCVHGRRVLKSS